MVAGKVKAAMGLQKSPATPKLGTSRRSSSSPSSVKSTGVGTGSISNGRISVFSRSFGVYFPKSSAQVQPRPPDVAELLRLVEDLRERETRLKTQLLEQKLLKEAVSFVPFLEKEVATKNDELHKARQGAETLEAENRALRLEIEKLVSKILEDEEERRRRNIRISEMEAEIEELRRTASELRRTASELRRSCGAGAGETEADECSSSKSSSSLGFQGLIYASARSSLLKNIRKSYKSTDLSWIHLHEESKPETKEREIERVHQPPRCEREEILKPRPPRVPKPPPLPSNSPSNSSSSSETTTAAQTSIVGSNLVAPPPLSSAPPNRANPGPPPPPPPPAAGKGGRTGAASVRRVPEVVEFYHSLMRRDSKKDSGSGGGDAATAGNVQNMIGEIKNRSAHLLAIKTEVETQGDFIRFLIKEVENAAFSNVEDLVAFVKWLDEELSFLVDERAVLKHFEWPEAKSDAMREAAFGYCDLRKLEAEASSFRDDPRQPCASATKKMQSLLEKLEHGVYNLTRVREGAMERYKNFQIPSEWMLDRGIVSQIKLASVKLAMKYVKRVTSEIEAGAGGPEEEDLMLQGVRFAFRVHQFAGGFDVETMRAFQELKDKARSLQAHKQNQQQEKLSSKSLPLTSC